MGEKRVSSGRQDFEGKFDFESFWQKFKLPIAIGLVGLILVGIGVFSILTIGQKEPEIQILPAENVATASSILVDLEGAVEQPGVYELPANARINDLLVKAGGLAALADRAWVEKNLNLAQKLIDGSKLYIPKLGEKLNDQTNEVAGASASISQLINLNSATLNQLDSLWGIGSARAQSIIDNRPYQSIEELLSKKVIPSNVYERIKEQITVY